MKLWFKKSLALALVTVMVLGFFLISGNTLTVQAEDLVLSGADKYDITELSAGRVVYTGTAQGILELNVPVGANDDIYAETVLKQGNNFNMSDLRYGFYLAEGINFNVVSKSGDPYLQMTDWSFYNNYNFTEAQLAAYQGDGLRIAVARIDGVFKMYADDNGKMVCVATQEVASKATAAFNLKLRCYPSASGAEFNQLNWKVGTNVLPYYAEGGSVVSGQDKFDISEILNGKVVYTATSEGILELNAPVGAEDNAYIEAVLKKGENFDMANLRYGFCLANINVNIVSDKNGVRAQMTNWSITKNYTLTAEQLAAFEGDGLRIGAARVDGIYKMYIENNGNMVCVASQEYASAATAYNLKIRCYKQAAGAEYTGIRWFVGEDAVPDDVSASESVISGIENFDISELNAGKVTYTGTKAASLEFNAPVGANDDVYAEMVLKKGEEFDMENLRLGFKFAGVHFDLTSNAAGFSLQITDWSFYENYKLDAEEIATFEGDGLRIGAARISGVFYLFVENNGKMACVLEKEIADKATAEFNVAIESYATSPYAEFTQLDWRIGKSFSVLSIIDNGDSLGYTLTSENAGAVVTWSSSNENVVKVDENGNLTYVGTGDAIITASVDNLTACKKITVYAVSYDAGANGENPATVFVRSGHTVTAPTMADNGIWQFKGWYKDDQAFDFATPITASVDLTAKWEKNSSYPIIQAWNVTLNDNIGINFVINVADEFVNDSTVEIVVEGTTTVINLGDVTKNEKGQLLIPVDLAAAQMTESVQVKTLLNGVVIEDKVYTVRKYAEYILAGNYDADTKALVKEMLNYGAKAQQYFNCNTDDLANSGYEIQPAGQIPSEALSSVKDGSVEGVTYYGASLLYENKITVRFYFIVDGNIGDYTFSAGDPVMKSNMYYVDIPGINPQDYDKNVTVTVTKGTETLCITYSPMHYITRMYNRETTDGSLKSLLEAMYGYHIVACTYLNSQNWENDDALKILAIGNSFSTDGMAYVYQIAEDLGVKKIKLGNLYIGGCSLNTHYNNISNNNAAYTYYVNEDGNWVTNENYTIQAALESENWDYITLQQASGYSGDEASYSNLNSLIAEVKEICPSAKLVWHMTWAYQSDSTHADFAKYNNDQTTMYQAILSAVQSKVVTNEDIITIIPSGTAIQNARTSYIGDTLTRDGYHLSYDLGRYIAGITWVEALTGLDASNLTYCPDGMSKEMMALAIESAHSATENPFAVTNNRTLESSFIELDLDYQLGYYNSNYDSYDLLASSDKTPYYATQLFTKEDLPEGTVIVYTGSYEYRPEGWVNGEGVGRPGSTKTQYVVIDDAWWGKFTERGFNVKVASISVSEEEIAEVFKIYVPKSAY